MSHSWLHTDWLRQKITEFFVDDVLLFDRESECSWACTWNKQLCCWVLKLTFKPWSLTVALKYWLLKTTKYMCLSKHDTRLLIISVAFVDWFAKFFFWQIPVTCGIFFRILSLLSVYGWAVKTVTSLTHLSPTLVLMKSVRASTSTALLQYLLKFEHSS